MKCNKCGAEWLQGKATISLAKCPFCGELLIEQQKPDYLTLDVALKQLFEEHGVALLQNPKKLIAIFRDIAPQLQNELKVLEIALNSGIGKYFMACPLEERKKNVNRAIQAIAFLNDETKEMVISAFVKALAWDEVNIDALFDSGRKNNIKPTELEKKAVVATARTEKAVADIVYAEGVENFSIDSTLLENDSDIEDEGLSYNNSNYDNENNQNIIQPVNIISGEQYNQAKPVLKNDVTEPEKKTIDNVDSEHKNHSFLKLLLAVIIGGCIFNLFGGVKDNSTPERKKETDTKIVVKNSNTSFPIINKAAIIGASHSSADQEGTYIHSAQLAVDGNTASCWSEGVAGLGIGESITISFNGTYEVKGMLIWPGHQKSDTLFYQNARPTVIRVVGSDGYSERCNIADRFGMQRINFNRTMNASSIQLIIEQAKPGTKYADTCIGEVEFF